MCSRYANYKQMCFDDLLSSLRSPFVQSKFTDEASQHFTRTCENLRVFLSVEIVGESQNSSLFRPWVSLKSDLASLVTYLWGGVLSLRHRLQPQEMPQVAMSAAKGLASLSQLEKVVPPGPH